MAWLQQEEAARRRQEEALERERISYAQVSSGIQARRRKGWGGGGDVRLGFIGARLQSAHALA